MKSTTQRQQISNQRLLEMLFSEKENYGKHVYTNKRKTVEEMLRMRGVSF